MSDLTYDALFKYAKYFSVNYFDSFDVMETSAWRSMKETAWINWRAVKSLINHNDNAKENVT